MSPEVQAPKQACTPPALGIAIFLMIQSGKWEVGRIKGHRELGIVEENRSLQLAAQEHCHLLERAEKHMQEPPPQCSWVGRWGGH